MREVLPVLALLALLAPGSPAWGRVVRLGGSELQGGVPDWVRVQVRNPGGAWSQPLPWKPAPAGCLDVEVPDDIHPNGDLRVIRLYSAREALSFGRLRHLPRYLFYRYEAVRPMVTEGVGQISMTFEAVPDAGRIGLALGLFLGAVGLAAAWWMRRRLAEQSRRLDSLSRVQEEAEMRVMTAGADPVKVGPYTILGRLGEGGMARVYRARDPHGDLYALKIPHPDLLASEEYRQRFKREAEIAMGLKRHPGICAVYDVRLPEDGGLPFLALEYVEGRTLRDMLNKAGRLPVPLAVRLAAQVARALDHAHRFGITHRDVKPENIMVTLDGRVKLMDLGIAKGTRERRITLTGALVGTPGYMAPEQVEGNPVDGRADLYSLGMTLYEMVTGVLPFGAAGDPVQSLVRRLTEEPEPPSRHNPDLGPELEALILGLLARQPEDRPPNGRAVSEALLALCPESNQPDAEP